MGSSCAPTSPTAIADGSTLRFPRPCSMSNESICSETGRVWTRPGAADDGLTVQLDLRPFEVVSLRVVSRPRTAARPRFATGPAID